MRKLFIIAMIFIAVKKALALPVGNPASPILFCEEVVCNEDGDCEDPCDLSFFSIDNLSLNIGFYGDYVFNRHLETVTGRQVDYCQISTNAAYFAINYCELFDVFATLGATKFCFNSSLGPFNSTNPSPRLDFESSTAFSCSVGAHATLFEYKCFTMGIMGQYFSSNPHAKVLFVRANVDAYPGENSTRKYSEWQIGVGASYHYNEYFIPYAAVKYSRARWRFNNEIFLLTSTLVTVPTLRNSKSCGYAVGLTFMPFKCEKLAVTVEGRFVDETAVYVNGQAHF